jgi:hypothetical protein
MAGHRIVTIVFVLVAVVVPAAAKDAILWAETEIRRVVQS